MFGGRRFLTSYQEDVRKALAKMKSKSQEECRIELPSYIIDYSLLSLIRKDNHAMLQLYLDEKPDLVQAYIYKETYEIPEKWSTLHSVIVATLLGHAFIYSSLKCIRLLLEHKAKVNDYAYIISIWKPGTDKAKTCVTMTSSISCIARQFVLDGLEKNVEFLRLLKGFNVNLAEATHFQRDSIEADVPLHSRSYQAHFLKHLQTELIASKHQDRTRLAIVYTDMFNAYMEQLLNEEPFTFDLMAPAP
ncbi:hypothetical protein Ciccas_003294 [Cichlidogyrus casuarinus]|uniref:Uncharacterized protein n=1 Tax=Cichlidogyrus casuarinus TaxID=1844966 RepID=A0ABD2QES7_9PLAT